MKRIILFLLLILTMSSCITTSYPVETPCVYYYYPNYKYYYPRTYYKRYHNHYHKHYYNNNRHNGRYYRNSRQRTKR